MSVRCFWNVHKARFFMASYESGLRSNLWEPYALLGAGKHFNRVVESRTAVAEPCCSMVRTVLGLVPRETGWLRLDDHGRTKVEAIGRRVRNDDDVL